MLDAPRGPAPRQHLNDHATPAEGAVARRLELAAVGARAMVALDRLTALVAPRAVVQHDP